MSTYNSWLIRKTVVTTMNSETGKDKIVIKFELVWGEMIDGRAKGESHHVLTGSTAEASMHAMADRLNKSGYKPPPSLPRTRADGFRNPSKFDA